MKKLVKAVTTCLVMALLVLPITVVADEYSQMPRTMDKAIFPGVTTVQFAGHTLVFNTDGYLRVKLSRVGPGQVELTVIPKSLPGEGESLNYSASTLVINWQNFNETIYDGSVPSASWGGVLDTEAGWTEK